LLRGTTQEYTPGIHHPKIGARATGRADPSMTDGPTRVGSEIRTVDERHAFERLLADLSARFVNLPAAEVDGAIVDALRRIVELLDVDRSALLQHTREGDTILTHTWIAPGIDLLLPVPRSVGARYPWVLARARAGIPVVFSRPDELPPEAAIDRATIASVRLRSHITMPFRVAGKVEGALGLGCLRRERDWPAELVERIGVLATILGNALAHKRAQESLDAAVTFERTMSEVLRELLTAARAEHDRVIEAGLARMARLFGAERATLWQRLGEKVEFVKTHRWLAEGLPPPSDALGPVDWPWVSAQLAAAAEVRFARHADLPPEAATDIPRLQALGIRSAVIVPLVASGAVVGALSFATAQNDVGWPDELIPRMRLVGEVFAGVLARRAAERREQEAQAQAAHAARVGTMGVFAASLVHELTQPLAASLANAESAADLLAARSPDLEEVRATVGDIVADDRRAGELIQELRRFLRRGEVQWVELDLRQVIDEVLRLAGGEAADKAVAVTLDVPDDLLSFVGDRVQIQQVLLNLLLNAFDAVAANDAGARRVEVRAWRSGAGVSIEVTDSGRGIDEATLGRVFEPFFTTKSRGMGLGLSISRTIVSTHGGTLLARSAPGEGATFRVELPSRPPSEGAPAPRQAAVAGGTGTVFVIDDDAPMRRALERQLERAGYRVAAFASARDYLDRPAEGGVACIVSDVRMPGLSGLDLQASLAQAGRDLPMVFISGHGDVATAAHAMKAGAVHFLAKPFTKNELLGAVAEALARSREVEGARKERAALQARYDTLTPREREVFALVASGLLNKVIADRLGAAEATVKIHRGRVMEKMGADSVADLVRMCERLGLASAESAPS
jgi:FixJ family two-component response regulator/signal transduction histidine kinase